MICNDGVGGPNLKFVFGSYDNKYKLHITLTILQMAFIPFRRENPRCKSYSIAYTAIQNDKMTANCKAILKMEPSVGFLSNLSPKLLIYMTMTCVFLCLL